MSKIVVHTFYAGDRAVWKAEWFCTYTESQLKHKAEELEALGMDKIDTVTDSTGRLVRLV